MSENPNSGHKLARELQKELTEMVRGTVFCKYDAETDALIVGIDYDDIRFIKVFPCIMRYHFPADAKLYASHVVREYKHAICGRYFK